MVGDGNAFLHTGIPPTKRLLCVIVQDNAAISLCGQATTSRSRGRKLQRCFEGRCVEDMVRVGVLYQLNIFSSLCKTIREGAARRNGHPIIGRAMQKTNGLRNIVVFTVLCAARRVHADMCCELKSGTGAVHFLEPVEARI